MVRVMLVPFFDFLPAFSVIVLFSVVLNRFLPPCHSEGDSPKNPMWERVERFFAHYVHSE